MKRCRFALLALALSCATTTAQSVPAPGEMSRETPPPPPDDSSAAPSKSATTASTKASHPLPADAQAIIDRLSRDNGDLLDLLKQQQDVLKDMQYDRRLQARQITLLEQRLEDALQTNSDLAAKVAKLQAAAATPAPSTNAVASAATPEKTDGSSNSTAAPAPPTEPASYLPAVEADGAPGTMWWHRLLAISGDDTKNSDIFHIKGKQWRVLWHNQDKPGDVYKNTSALFVNAFPANGAIPKKVCSQLGSGGDAKELTGTGDYYLKIEASGGHWELAVEDFY